MSYTIKISLIFALTYFIITPLKTTANPPNFSEIKDIKQKKTAFFNYLSPIAKKENQEVIITRDKIKDLISKPEISEQDKNWLKKTAEKYGIQNWDYKSKEKQQELLNRVDIIPIPMLLAQAANESAWGTSRFAKQGNKNVVIIGHGLSNLSRHASTTEAAKESHSRV